VFRLLTLLPLPLLRLLFGGAAFALRVAGWRRQQVSAFVERCLAERPQPERTAIVRGFYAYLGELVAEVLHGDRMPAAELEARVRFENPEAVRSMLEGGRRVMILAAHHCNWEWLLLRCSTGLGEPLVAAYTPAKLESGDRALRRMRSRFGATMVPAKQVVQHLIEQRGKVRLLAMVADQSPSARNEAQTWLPFFGQETSFFQGPGWIAAKMGYVPVFAAMRREQPGHYAVRFVPLAGAEKITDPDVVLRAYAAALEAHVREQPVEYFWAYNRWKRTKRLYE
jgi:KDO2-lipid IV(A) lauroyltransferase